MGEEGKHTHTHTHTHTERQIQLQVIDDERFLSFYYIILYYIVAVVIELNQSPQQIDVACIE
jgi:hypothetical protein